MTVEPDYYAILEVKPDADENALREAYRRLAWRFHPDIAGPDGSERMREINIAYQVLSDPARRKTYDAGATSARVSVRRDSAPRTAAARVGMRAQREGPAELRHRLTSLDQIPIVAAGLSGDGKLWAVGQLDGRISIFNANDGAAVRALTFDGAARAGALQSLRLSRQGLFLVAWGFSLGTRVWSLADGKPLWNTGISGPTGVMDAVVQEDPATARLAAPDAPLALGSDDPFRWADEGRRVTAVYARPLAPQVNPAWLTPLRCVEDGNLGLLREPPDENWRIHQRILSADGRSMVTFSTGQVATIGRAGSLRLWDLDKRNLLGSLEPRVVGRVSEVAGLLQTPLATTPDLRWAAAGVAGRQIRLFDLRARRQRSVEVGILGTEARIALSADGAWLALARASRLQLFRTETGDRMQEWEAGSDVMSLGFSQDSSAVVLSVGLRSGLAELWSIRGG